MKKNYIALGGLFASLHVLFLLVSKVIVGSELLLVLFLPLLSTMYTLKAEKKNVFVFIIAVILVCCIFDFISTFIYIIPSLVCGVVYGLLRKKDVKELELLVLTGVCHIFSLFFSFLVISLLFKEVDFVNVFSLVLGLEGKYLVVASFYLFVVLGFSEAFLVHMVSDKELGKIVTSVKKNESVPRMFIVGFIISLIGFIVTCFIDVIYSVLFSAFLIIFLVPYIVNGIIEMKYKVLTLSLVGLFSFVSVLFIGEIDVVCHNVVLLFILSPFVINNFFSKSKKTFKSDINEVK